MDTMITSRNYGYKLVDSKEVDVKIVATSKGMDYVKNGVRVGILS
jgi:hypothetical protein